ncbi:hypothetical protein AXW83_03225 [Bosea sp. PAMC 26642]|nr:hypothetical protein AXW83_03225 [Bosea sp. PAMC 26642]
MVELQHLSMLQLAHHDARGNPMFGSEYVCKLDRGLSFFLSSLKSESASLGKAHGVSPFSSGCVRV